jgi:hypothetical protein
MRKTLWSARVCDFGFWCWEKRRYGAQAMEEKHYTRFWVLLAFAGTLFLGALTLAAPSAAETLHFDFSSGMGSEFFFYNPTGVFALDDTHGKLRLIKLTGGSDDSLKLAKVVSNVLIGGNFDIRVDYRLYRSLDSGDQLEFQLYGHNFIFFNVRSNESSLGGDQYHTFLGPRNLQPIPAIATSDTRGTLRFVREADIINAYFKSPGAEDFTLIYSEVFDDVYVRFAMALKSQPFNPSPLDAAFDNLSIEADTLLHYPPDARAW